MKNFRLYIPTDIHFGNDRLDELPEILAEYGKKVLLTYGGGSIKRTGLYDKISDLLDEAGFEVTELSGIAPNPKIDSVRKGVALIRENDIEVILAVGGGSVIDASKVIAGGVYYEGDPWDLVLDNKKMGQAIPIVDVLTLAATGTEMNRNAVISNPETNEKLGTSGWNLIPKASFLDPVNTFSVPKNQTAAGSADILSHLFEQYFNRTKGTDVQDNIAEGLMKAVIKNCPVALENPEDYNARANLMWSSTLALNGIPGNGRSGGWTCHPIEHELSAYYDITHGVGLAILTPRWMKFCVDTDPTTHEKFATYARNVWDVQEKDNEKAAHIGIEKTYHYFKKTTSVPMTLPEVGIADTKLVHEMSEHAVKNGHLGIAPFVPLEVSDVEKIINECFTDMTEF
ncbi:MAG: iron-containing alcohol dehydrogenase [Lactobacillales bacterium]|jgi:alcohol dehydrogenase YqhD (iron-dependent ADH family)|nr:iron-containing alcohol dehydrogenase [Lactobacillales bacterium]